MRSRDEIGKSLDKWMEGAATQEALANHILLEIHRALLDIRDLLTKPKE